MYPREPIETPSLVLVPTTRELVQAILVGDLSGVRAGEGWPMEDSLVSMRTAKRLGVEFPGWLVTLGAVVIGDSFTHGDVDVAGDIEIGYNLAEPYRGRGYGTELVQGLSQWLLAQAGIKRVVARHVAVGNMPSRRALESAGFVLEREDEQYTWYALTPTG